MDILQLRYFITVAHYQHITRAAEKLHVAQPAISQMIARLEKELGVELFDRIGKNIRLNNNGRLFLKRAKSVVSDFDDMQTEIRDFAGKSPGHISLSVLAASNLFPDILAQFRKKYPDIDFLLLHTGQDPNYDLRFSSIGTTAPPADSEELLNEDLLLAVPNNHPFASRKNIDLAEAKDEKFISLSRNKPFRVIADSYCALAGFTPNIVFESDNPATWHGLISAGLGVAFVPALSWGNLPSKKIHTLNVRNPLCRRSIILSWPTNRYLSDAAKLFKDFSKKYIRKRFPTK